jgi:DNA-binding MarR family transcriptional regulator
MDITKRQITKIARELNKLTIKTLKSDGVGSGEFDLIHAVRHHPGLSQKEICEILNMDKGAAAHRVASLENKGYLIRKSNPADKRSQLLFATEEAEHLKNSKASVETAFYEWLLEELPEADRAEFTKILNVLYQRSKKESRAGFPNVTARLNAEKSE